MNPNIRNITYTADERFQDSQQLLRVPTRAS